MKGAESSYMNALFPLLLCLCQSPQAPADAAAPQRLDVVTLKNGDELTGRVTAELDGYVEVEIETGAVIGVSRAMVKEVRRGAVDAPDVVDSVRPEDAWFVLHDADGRSVGWLHSAVTLGNSGTFTVSEEYEFSVGARRYQITSLCTGDQNGDATSCYFRERISEPKLAVQHLPNDDPLASRDRIVDERIVEADCKGELLVVRHLDGSSRSERTLPWTAKSTFPLLARTLARQRQTSIGPVAMFDARGEELIVRTIDATGARHVELDGRRMRVTEVSETTAAGHNREWLDADMNTVRRELAGPALVAVPSSASSARGAVGVTSIASAIVAEADGRFGLWVPNPAWVAVEPLPAGHLALRCAAHDAEVRLSLLEHLDDGTVLDSAADAVAKWFVLMHPQLQVDSRHAHRVRERDGVRMHASTRGGVRGERATIDVVPHDGRFLVLICRAPRAAWDELDADFTFISRTIELDAPALTPPLQGPLDEKTRRPTGPVRGPQPAPRVEKAEKPQVRIPSDS